jgi:hypothetical protein
MRIRATQVMRKLVDATVREVSVGLANPMRVNMVAEKYINEFYVAMLVPIVRIVRTTYETA